MLRSAPAPLLRTLLAALLGTAALGCGAGEDARRPVKEPPLAASPAPVAAAVAEPQGPVPTPAAPPEPAAPAEAAEIERALFAIKPDPAPPQITLNTHYVVSNEDKPQVFYEPAAKRGGVYVGVGAEQSFLFGGWSRADLLFLMDFDDWVVDVNEVYGLMFEHVSSPDELFAKWGPDHLDEVKAWIKERAPDSATAERRLQVYEKVRSQVQYRLKWLRSHLAGQQRPFFANDQAEFDHIAQLWRNKRVRCVRGDLTASGALRAFGDLARRAGWVVRVLYLSNAELYFSYEKDGFRDNIRSLPFDERSIVLHTHPLEHGGKYHYIWQEAPSYVTWAGRVKNFRDLLVEAKLPQLGKLENGAWLIKPP